MTPDLARFAEQVIAAVEAARDAKEVLAALEQSGPWSQGADAALRDAVTKHADAAVRARAAAARDAARARLEAALDAGERGSSLLWRLSNLGDPRAAGALARAVERARDARERCDALRQLGYLNDAAACPTLIAHTTHADADVRYHAVLGLQTSLHPGAAPALRRALADPDGRVAGLAAGALERLQARLGADPALAAVRRVYARARHDEDTGHFQEDPGTIRRALDAIDAGGFDDAAKDPLAPYRR